MRNFALNSERLVAVCNNLGDAVADPTLWPQIMDDICAAAGATGGALLQSDIRTPDIRALRASTIVSNIILQQDGRRATREPSAACLC